MTGTKDGTLVVEFIDEIHRLLPGDQLTFGRHGDLKIDDNRNLHRILGRFFNEHGVWWLVNEGRAIPVQVADRDSRTTAIVAPGSRFALSFADAVVRFSAGPTDYELTATQQVEQSVGLDMNDERDFTATFSSAPISLTADQRLLLVMLAEKALRDPHATVEVGSSAEMAMRLGWTVRRFHRKIDNVCEKFTKAGVRGLHGSVDNLATDRRRRLVEHCIAIGIVTVSDLSLLEKPDINRSEFGSVEGKCSG